MKTAEKFLNENGISFSQTSKDVFGNKLLNLMEKFRKEALEEAYVSGFLENFGRFYISNKPDKEVAEDSFQEWYNNQIKE